MNSKVQSQLDAQIAAKRAAQVVEASDAPTFTPDIFERDNAETARVEVNFRDMSARLIDGVDSVVHVIKDEELQKPPSPTRIINNLNIYRNPLTLQVILTDAELADTDTPGTIMIGYLNSHGDSKSETLSFETTDCELRALDLLSNITVTEVRTAGWAGGTLSITIETPKLTHEDLKTLGKPIKTVEMFFDRSFWQVVVRDGIPLETTIQQLKKMIEYGDREKDPVAMAERDLEISRMTLSDMMVDPPFSFRGKGTGTPIEDRSEVMLASLSAALNEVNTPKSDMIFQVTVRRGTPEDAFQILGDFNWYSVGTAGKKYTDMSEEEFSAEMARVRARRQVLVPAMIVDPELIYTHVVDDEDAGAVEPPEDAEAPYPVELLSERFMQTLEMAHKVVTTPDAALRSLQRHF